MYWDYASASVSRVIMDTQCKFLQEREGLSKQWTSPLFGRNMLASVRGESNSEPACVSPVDRATTAEEMLT